MGHLEGFFEGGQDLFGRYSQDNLVAKKVKASSKNPKKCLIICFAPDKKNNLQDFQNQRFNSIFMSLREREF
jgi:hypothetical protein